MLIFTLLCSSLLFSCSEREPEIKAITIGWIGPLTGPVSLLGVDNLNAIKLALEDYHNNKRPKEPDILLVAEDDQYDATKSVDAYKRLVENHKPTIIFLSTYTAMFLLADDALRDGIVIVNPIDNDKNLAKLNKNTITIAKPTDSLAEVIEKALLRDERKNIFILYYKGDDFMPAVALLLAERLKSVGKEYQLQSYVSSNSSFEKEIERAKILGSDAYVMLGYSEIGHAMNLARHNQIDASFYTANIMMKDIASGAMEGTQFFDMTYLDANEQLARILLQRYEKRFKQVPILQWTIFQAFDAANIIIDIVKQPVSERESNIEHILSKIYSTKNYQGVSGDITILEDGTSSGITPGLYEYSGNKVKKVVLSQQ